MFLVFVFGGLLEETLQEMTWKCPSASPIQMRAARSS